MRRYKDDKINDWLKANKIAIIAIACLFGLFLIALSIPSDHKPDINANSNNVKEEDNTNQINLAELKQQAINVKYKELFRHNEKYIGKIIYYPKVKVIQTLYNDQKTLTLRLEVIEDEDEDYSDKILYVSKYQGPRILEGDLVEVWGQVKGLKTYKSILGATITIPEIKIIDLKLTSDIKKPKTDVKVNLNKNCADGTKINQCSTKKPFFCSEEGLIENPEKCGCPKGTSLEDGRCVIPKTVEITDGRYSANNLKFDITLWQNGYWVTYLNRSKETKKIKAGDGKKLLKFDITVQSLEDGTDFYVSDFYLMDDEGITYNPVCPLDTYGILCDNSDGLNTMYDALENQKTTGYLMFEIPRNVDKVWLIYKFTSYKARPKYLKFLFDEV